MIIYYIFVTDLICLIETCCSSKLLMQSQLCKMFIISAKPLYVIITIFQLKVEENLLILLLGWSNDMSNFKIGKIPSGKQYLSSTNPWYLQLSKHIITSRRQRDRREQRMHYSEMLFFSSASFLKTVFFTRCPEACI